MTNKHTELPSMQFSSHEPAHIINSLHAWYFSLKRLLAFSKFTFSKKIQESQTV